MPSRSEMAFFTIKNPNHISDLGSRVGLFTQSVARSGIEPLILP